MNLRKQITKSLNKNFMRKIFCILIIAASVNCLHAQSIGIGTAAPNASAQLDVTSTSKGLLLPRMTLAQRNLIVSPATGLLVYQTDNTPGFYYYNGASWIQFSTGSSTNYWTDFYGNHIFNNNASGNVTIGGSASLAKFTVQGPMAMYDVHPSLLMRRTSYTSVTSSDISFQLADGSDEFKIIHALNRLYLIRGSIPYNTNPSDFVLDANGNIGIGTISPDVKLNVQNGSNITSTNGGYLQIGDAALENIAIDNNEIQARTNGAATRLVIQNRGGPVQIGTASVPGGYKLGVEGKMICEELKIQNSANWPDYVFDKNYKLRTPEDLQKFIAANHHLPDIPPAAEMEKNGIQVGDMQKKLLEKIEELTLYILQQDEQIKSIREELRKLISTNGYK
jgi:hypothetical protein